MKAVSYFASTLQPEKSISTKIPLIAFPKPVISPIQKKHFLKSFHRTLKRKRSALHQQGGKIERAARGRERFSTEAAFIISKNRGELTALCALFSPSVRLPGPLSRIRYPITWPIPALEAWRYRGKRHKNFKAEREKKKAREGAELRGKESGTWDRNVKELL